MSMEKERKKMDLGEEEKVKIEAWKRAKWRNWMGSGSKRKEREVKRMGGGGRTCR